MELIAWMLLTILPPNEGMATYHVFEIERNYVHDDAGCVTLDQYVYRDEREIRDWRMANKAGEPRKDWASGFWVARWMENGMLIEVRAREYYETHSTFDVEIAAREFLPLERRRRIGVTGVLP